MGPIRGQTRPLPVMAEIAPEVQRIDAKLDTSIHNRFDIEIINAETGKVRQRAQAENVICNQLWSKMFNSSDSTRKWNNYIHIGKGTGTPSTADTSLFNFLGYGTPETSNDVYSLNNSTGVLSLKRKITLLETQYVGSTLTEVGIGSGTSSGTLCTHAMLKDMNGNQISIVKTSTDIINIYSTVFVHWNAAGISNTHCIFEKTTDPFAQWLLGLSDQSPIWYAYFYNGTYHGSSITKGNYGATFAASFNASSKTLTQTISRMAASEGNLTGGINTIACWPFAIPLSNDYTVTEESIATGDGATKDFFTDFGFIQAGTIFVNGVADNSVTIDTAVPCSKDVFPYCVPYDSSGNQVMYKYMQNSLSYQTPNLYFYNPFYELGLESITLSTSDNFYIYASNDLVTWTKIKDDYVSSSSTIPGAYANYKYWRVQFVSGSFTTYVKALYSKATGNVHFASPPSNGAAITGTYTTKSIPKDSNHVFDFSIAVQLGEHAV